MSSKMKILLLGVTLLFLAGPFDACAQIVLKISIKQKAFLLYEPVYMQVHMRNVSGHPLVFGKNRNLAGSIQFEIRNTESGDFVPLIGRNAPPVQGIVLQSGATKAFTYNVSHFYSLFRTGIYTARAVISHPRMPKSYVSNELRFSIVNGTLIWQTVVGIPQEDRTGDKTIETRRYSVRSYFNGKHAMYMLLIDDSKKVYCVRHLGYFISNMLPPQCAVDDISRLHVLVAGSPKVFSYCVFDLSGKLISGEVRIKSNTTPHISVNKELGTVVLYGGRKAKRDTDYEEIKDIPFLKGVMDDDRHSIVEGSASLFDDVEELPGKKAAPAKKGQNPAPGK